MPRYGDGIVMPSTHGGLISGTWLLLISRVQTLMDPIRCYCYEQRLEERQALGLLESCMQRGNNTKLQVIQNYENCLLRLHRTKFVPKKDRREKRILCCTR